LNILAGKPEILCLRGRNTGEALFTAGRRYVETDGKTPTIQTPEGTIIDREEAGMMKRILIVDDDAAIQLLYEEELSEEGYDIISSDGEKDLLQLIAAKKPNLVLLDVKLRSRSGLSLLQDIRKAFHGIPTIVTTAYPTFQIDLKSLGADAYVTKNYDLTGLKQQIEKCLATPGRLEEKGIISGKNAQTTAMEPAVQLGMRFHK
jgi:DNA-binding NtrC family response regulator